MSYFRRYDHFKIGVRLWVLGSHILLTLDEEEESITHVYIGRHVFKGSYVGSI